MKLFPVVKTYFSCRRKVLTVKELLLKLGQDPKEAQITLRGENVTQVTQVL